MTALAVKRCAAICGVVILTGCAGAGTPRTGATDPTTPRETARSASPSPTGCEEPCTTPSTPTASGNANAPAPSATSPAGGSASAPTARGTQPSPYSRDEFGTGWTDPDHNGCDARQDAIRAATSNRVMAGPCKITRADIHDRYTGRTYPAANPSAFDIDHVVALHDAWNSGAAAWPRARRVAFANDPANLVLTSASLNRSKGDQGPDTWAPLPCAPISATCEPPSLQNGPCWYAAKARQIKLRWRLRTRPAERAAIRRTLATCTGTENR